MSTQCAVCGNDVENLEVRNGEMLCDTCYKTEQYEEEE